MKKLILLLLTCTMFISLSAQDKKEKSIKKKSDVERQKGQEKSVDFSDFNMEENFELFGIDLNADGQLQFIPNANDLSSPAVLTINDENGYIGIGTTTPSKILDINNTTTNSSNIIDLQNSSASGYTAIDFADNAGSGVMGFGYANPSAAFIPGNAYLDVKGGNDFLFMTESNEKMRMTNDGKLGIGTNNPERNLHVFKGSAGAVTANANATGVFENDFSNYLQMLSPDNSESGILFGSPTGDAANGGILYRHGSSSPANTMLFRTNGNVTRMSLDGEGKLNLIQSTGDEMVIINDNDWTHSSGLQSFTTGGDHFMMASKEGSSESAGIYGDGTSVTLWSPGDGGTGFTGALVAVCDEDSFTSADTDPYNNSALKWYLTASGGWIASDIERKENIQAYDNSLDKISALDVYTYNYKLAAAEVAKGQVNPEVVGIIAQDLNEVIPQAVNITPNGEHFINYNQVTPVLIGAVKELTEENNELKERLATLEAAIEALARD